MLVLLLRAPVSRDTCHNADDYILGLRRPKRRRYLVAVR